MKNKIALFFCALAFSISFAQRGQILVKNKIDWRTRSFLSVLSMDFTKSDIVMPSGRPIANDRMLLQLPNLVKDPLLWTTVDSSTKLGDMILSEQISFSAIKQIIDGGKSAPSFFLPDTPEVQLEHSVDLNEISALLVNHAHTYEPSRPIDKAATRKYTGIIIDARGKLPVHGEFTQGVLEPSFFPKIWDEKMDLLFEKNMVDPQIAREKGIVLFETSDDISLCEERVGKDPLQIIARKVYGIYHTDPVLSRSDALKILSLPENIELIRQGKIAILVNAETAAQDVVAPKRSDAYFASLQELQARLRPNIVDDDIQIHTPPAGIAIAIHNVKFRPDSDEILPSEAERIEKIAKAVQAAAKIGNYKVKIEGHTARVGDISTEIPLSERRALTIMQALIDRGISKEILSVQGFGGDFPIADNSTPEGRAQNRRVEIILREGEKN